jgi:hypothetical protein
MSRDGDAASRVCVILALLTVTAYVNQSMATEDKGAPIGSAIVK